MDIDLIKIGPIIDSSTIDWPKKSASVIFMSKCQLRCPWCQNPDLVKNKGKKMPISYVIDRILENRKLIDGVVITGGEPTLQKKALFVLCSKLKKLNLDIMLDTNGIEYGVISDLVSKNLIQRLSIDFKAPDDDINLFKKITGIENEQYLENFKKTLNLSKDWDIKIEFRTTIIPNLNDKSDIVYRITKKIKKCDLYILQQFRAQKKLLDPTYSNLKSPDVEKLRKLANIARKNLDKVMIRSFEVGEEIL